MLYKCEICEKEFDSLASISKHNGRKHGIHSEQTFIKYKLNGLPPKCKCGCGEFTKYLTIEKGFREYVLGHSSRVNNNWGHNPEALRKSKETQKKMYESGEIEVWNKGLTKEVDSRLDYGHKFRGNKERSEKLSKAFKGVKRPEWIIKKFHEGMRRYWNNPENKERKSVEQSIWVKNYHYKTKTNLEKTFQNLLDDMGLTYIEQYVIFGYNFDFYLSEYDIAIEVDGDFYHCNPKIYIDGPIYQTQRNTIKNDTKKNKICESIDNLKLLRFWESDINNNIEWVKNELFKHLT